MNRRLQAILAATVIVGGGAFYAAFASAEKNTASTAVSNPYAPTDSNLAVATVAGGCFWCVEAGYEKIPGVVEAVSGYAGGLLAEPAIPKLYRYITTRSRLLMKGYCRACGE